MAINSLAHMPALVPCIDVLKTELSLEEEGDYEVYEEYTTDSGSAFSSPPLSPQTPRFNPRPTLHPVATMSRLINKPKTPLPQNRSFATLSPSARTASTLTLSRWDWKTLFYNLNFPLDHLILGLRRGNLSNSNSNLSVSSDGVESDDSSKPRLRANKVMRMGSFAYRATQFFENLGKKSSSKRKVSSLSSPTDAMDYNLKDGIQEESSLSSASIGMPAVSPSSEATSPVFEDSFRNSSAFSSPSSMEFPPLPPTPPPSIPSNIKHQGYLNIFSSFNKRRWGKRWCLVRENMFECYRTQTSQPCELNFLLKNCVLRQALAETNSPLALMLLENNREKITVEPPTPEELGQWLRVLMVETSTECVPPGLEEYFVEVDDNQVDDLTAALEAEYSDIVGASVLKSWEVGSVPILPNKDKTAAEDLADTTEDLAEDQSDKEDNPATDDPSADTMDPSQADKYLYSTVVKRPSFATLEQVEGNTENEQAETLSPQQEDGKIPRFTDNLAVYNANKNTTDSGFYSVKEANSDSESGSDVKTDTVSPAQEDSAPSASLEESASTVCNTSDKGVSDRAATSGKEAVEEEEEEESALEKTMTSEDFKDNLEGERTVLSEKLREKSDGGEDIVCSASNVEPAGEERNHGCENGVHKVNTERESCVPDSKERDSASGGGTTESHTHSEKVDSPITNSGDVQHREKSKKKKKKGKGKKNKPKPESEHASGKNAAADSVTSNPPSQSKPTSDNPEASGIPVCNPSSADQGAGGSKSSTYKDVVTEDKQLLGGGGGVCGSAVSAPGPEGGKATGSVHISKFSELIGKAENRKEENVGAKVKKSDRVELTDKRHVQISEHISSCAVSKVQNPVGDSGGDSIENLLDSWGLSSILTRGLVSDDSDFAEGGDDCLSSPRDRSSEEIHRQLSDDLPCFVRTVSGSVGAGSSVSGVDGSDVSDLTPAVQNEGVKAQGSEEDDVIVELKERIGRLREKLVQIKRKRIAVRDKRVRAFSAEERNVCDKEYLVLESECKETAAIIHSLEEELKAASLSNRL